MPNVQDGMDWRPNQVRDREQRERDRAVITGAAQCEQDTQDETPTDAADDPRRLTPGTT